MDRGKGHQSMWLYLLVASIAWCALSADGQSIPSLQPSWFEQRIDHFNTSDGRTFRQKYFVYTAFYRDGGPLLFYCGPETSELSRATATNLSLAVFAEKLGGVVVSAEHRYFGESLPFGNDSYTRENIAYLTVNQTLLDYVAIIQQVQLAMKIEAKAGVVVFGGSYGGFLSYLMRVHYPQVVNGSIASAAATCTFGDVDDSIWYTLVSQTYLHYNVRIGDDVINCGREIELGFDHLYKCVFNTSCRQGMQNDLNLCQSVNSITDGFLLLYFAKYPFSAAVQFDFPYAWPPFRVGDPLAQICKPMSPILRAKWGMQLFYNSTGSFPCFSYNFTSNTHVGIEAKPFQYITCRDFPQPIGGTGIFSVPQPVNFTRTSDSCQSRWGVRPNLDWWKSFVQEPLLKNGSNIAFINGGLDPVRGFSPIHDLTSTIHVFNVLNMPHTQDILYPNSLDSEAVADVREKQLQLIQHWIGLDETRPSFLERSPSNDPPPTIKSMCAHGSPR